MPGEVWVMFGVMFTALCGLIGQMISIRASVGKKNGSGDLFAILGRIYKSQQTQGDDIEKLKKSVAHLCESHSEIKERLTEQDDQILSLVEGL